MTEPVEYENIEDQMIKLFQEYRDEADLPIADFFENQLESLDGADRHQILNRWIDQFDTPDPAVKKPAALGPDDHVLARVIKLLLGRDISQVDLSSEELLESLGESINTVFESLNQLISVINTTLVGKQDTDQTIRQVIGYHLEGGHQTKTLEDYIGQIGKAFFASQEASRKAAHSKVLQILDELSPEKIEKETDVSRLSPMRKSKYYEVYELKYRKFEKWFESGRFMESFLREFERNCQKISI